ncbi:MAG: hypothetical protein WC628_00420 [Candidatus Omnitrophota bacterium]
MRKKLLLAGFLTLLISFFVFAANETLTITTYYPSPYGSYMNLTVMGSLGVGTTNPAGVLDVRPLPAVSGNGRDIYIYAQDGQTTGTRNGGNINLMPGKGRASGSGGNIILIPDTVSGSDSIGNVGIGTTAPQVKLDVNGTVRIVTATTGSAQPNSSVLCLRSDQQGFGVCKSVPNSSGNCDCK